MIAPRRWYHRAPWPEPRRLKPATATRSGNDGLAPTTAALDAALDRLAPEPVPSTGRDTPDLHVTAVRRLPAVAGAVRAVSRALDARLRRALAARGDLAALHASGRGDRPRARRPPCRRHHADRVGQDALLQRAGPARDSSGSVEPRAVSLSDQGARAGSARRASGRCAKRSDAPAPASRIGVFTYDGDTPQDARRTIRARAHLVLSNPDMVHSGILPHHPRWAKLFENLRYVIIDELHAYRGVFGSHLCNVLRRLRRICRHYGSNPVFLCSSATIANPRELAERLTEQPFELVDRSGAPRGEKFFVFVNPPVVNHQLGIRRSYLERDAAHRVGVPQAQPAADRLRAEPAVDRNPDDVSEGRFRRRAGRARADSRLPRRLSADPPARDREGAARGRGARGRLDQRARARHRHRRARRRGHGRLSGNDCGDVAARRPRGPPRRPSAAVMVASSAPLDQFIVRNPSYFFDASPERALIDPDNLHILVDHVKCAAFELPFTGDRAVRPHDLQEVLAFWRSRGSCTGPAAAAGLDRAESAARLGSAMRRSGPGPTNRIRPTRSACGRSRRTTSSSSTRPTSRASSARPISRAARPRSIRKRSTSSRRRCFRWRSSTSRDARRLCARSTATTTRRDHLYAGDDPRHVRRRDDAPDRTAPRTAKSTSSRASSASRRSSSTRTRTSARASSICPSSRCTRRRTG